MIQIAAVIIASLALLTACAGAYYAIKTGRLNRQSRAHWDATSERINRHR